MILPSSMMDTKVQLAELPTWSWNLALEKPKVDILPGLLT